jgi:hypothetical protein
VFAGFMHCLIDQRKTRAFLVDVFGAVFKYVFRRKGRKGEVSLAVL